MGSLIRFDLIMIEILSLDQLPFVPLLTGTTSLVPLVLRVFGALLDSFWTWRPSRKCGKAMGGNDMESWAGKECKGTRD